MLYRLAADLVLLVHFGFILLVIFGGLLALRWRWFPRVHLPVAIYGVAIELGGWICPLTPLELRLRHAGGQAGYEGGFVEHYILPVVYPAGLTREVQFVLAGLVLILNVVVYVLVRRRARRGLNPA